MAELKSIRKDLTGKTFGRLTVTGLSRITKNAHRVWSCDCSCGKKTVVFGTNLLRDHTTSCGCADMERKTKHGHGRRKGRSPVYWVWGAMIDRCSNPDHPSWVNYGGRGIAVCDRWKMFENFLADMGHPKKGEEIDRIDNSLGYCRENCQWASRTQQMRNTRKNKYITHNGETKCIAEWAHSLGLGASVLGYRLKVGWPLDRALSSVRFCVRK